MLSKLIKHEFKATAKLMLPLFLIVFVFSIMDRIVLSLHIFNDALVLIPIFITIFYITSLFAIGVVCFALMIVRFYKNLLTDEGYLMFTLPVQSHELINSKLFVSFIWYLASMVVIIGSLLLVFLNPETMPILRDEFSSFVHEMNTVFGVNNILLIVELILSLIFGLISNILIIYVSIAVGQLFRGHRVLGSIVSYVGITTVLQIISTILFMIIAYVFSSSFTDYSQIPQFFLPLCLLFSIVLSTIFYAVTNYLFKNKLNLE